MSVGHDGYLYVTANGFHEQARFHQGRDERRKPYYLYRLTACASTRNPSCCASTVLKRSVCSRQRLRLPG